LTFLFEIKSLIKNTSHLKGMRKKWKRHFLELRGAKKKEKKIFCCCPIFHCHYVFYSSEQKLPDKKQAFLLSKAKCYKNLLRP
jgi:hypothetical protein